MCYLKCFTIDETRFAGYRQTALLLLQLGYSSANPITSATYGVVNAGWCKKSSTDGDHDWATMVLDLSSSDLAQCEALCRANNRCIAVSREIANGRCFGWDACVAFQQPPSKPQTESISYDPNLGISSGPARLDSLPVGIRFAGCNLKHYSYVEFQHGRRRLSTRWLWGVCYAFCGSPRLHYRHGAREEI